MHLPQIAIAEHSYADLGFLHTKNKGFLRKDVSIIMFLLFIYYCKKEKCTGDLYLIVFI